LFEGSFNFYQLQNQYPWRRKKGWVGSKGFNNSLEKFLHSQTSALSLLFYWYLSWTSGKTQAGAPFNHLFFRLKTYFTNHHTYFADCERKNTAPTVSPMNMFESTFIFDTSNQNGASLQCKMTLILDEAFIRFRQRVKPPEISTL
jgi:hypothetical protein